MWKDWLLSHISLCSLRFWSREILNFQKLVLWMPIVSEKGFGYVLTFLLLLWIALITQRFCRLGFLLALLLPFFITSDLHFFIFFSSISNYPEIFECYPGNLFIFIQYSINLYFFFYFFSAIYLWFVYYHLFCLRASNHFAIIYFYYHRIFINFRIQNFIWALTLFIIFLF